MKHISANMLNRFWKRGVSPELNKKVNSTKVLSNVEEIEANTDADNIAGALALKEVNNSLTALTDSGAITGMDAREDGVYITYVPTSGADAVTKKLGSEIDISKSKVDSVKGGSYATGTNVSKSVSLSKGKYLIVATEYWTSNGANGGGVTPTFAISGGTITERTSYACLVDIPNSGTVTVSAPGNYYLYLFFAVFPL